VRVLGQIRTTIAHGLLFDTLIVRSFMPLRRSSLPSLVFIADR
jgi:uncharacterized membrane protein YdfJ with MMPL/SSD domain